MAANDFKLNTMVMKNPKGGFKIEHYNVTTLIRLANASMAGDYVATKRKFSFTYPELTGEEVDALINELYYTSKLFHTFTFPFNGAVKTATIYVGSFPIDLGRAGATSNWVWKNVSFDFIEK